MPREQKRSNVRFALLSLCLLIGLSLAVGSGFLYYYLDDTNRIKPLLARLIAEYTGRTIEINGALDIEISTTPRVTARQIRLGNTVWASHPDMVTADYLMVQIDLPDLLSGWINLLDFDAHGVQINLEESPDGVGNWVFFSSLQPSEVDDVDMSPRYEASTGEESDLAFIIQGLALQDVTVTFQLSELKPFDLWINKALETTDSTGHLTLTGDGTLDQKPWQLSSLIGPLDQLLSAGQVEADVDLQIHTTDLSVRGTVDNLANFDGVDIEVSLKGPDAQFYGDLLDLPHLFEGDIALSGALHPSGTGYNFKASGHIADFEVHTDLTVSDLRSFQSVAGTLSATGPEASAIGTALGISGLPEGPFRIQGSGRLADGALELSELQVDTANSRMTAQANFPDFPETERGQANLNIEGSDLSRLEALLGLSSLVAEPYSLSVNLQADTGEFLATLSFGTHQITAAGTLGTEPGLSGLQLAVEATGEDFGELSRVFNRQELHGPYSASWVVSIDRSALTIREFELQNGPLLITGTSHLPDFGSLEGFSANGSVKSSSLTDIGTYFDLEGLPDRSLDATAELHVRNGRYDLENTTLELGRAKYQISGTLGQLDSMEGLALDIAVSAPGLNAVLLQQLPEGYGQNPMQSSFRLIGQPGAVEIADFVMTAADSRLELNAHLAHSPQLIGSHFRIQASGPRLDTLLPPGAGYQPPGVPYQIAGRLELPSENVLAFTDLEMFVGDASARVNGTIDLATFSKTELTVHASGSSMSALGHFNTRPLPDIPFEMDSSLTGHDESIEISSLTLHWGDSDLQAAGGLRIDERPRLLLVGTSDRLSIVDLQSVLGREEPENVRHEQRRSKDPSDS